MPRLFLYKYFFIRTALCLTLFLSVHTAIAQEIEVNTKLISIKKMEEFRLYNEAGRQDLNEFESDVKIGYEKKYRWEWRLQSNSNAQELIYQSNYERTHYGNSSFSSRYLRPSVEIKIVQGLFGYKPIRRTVIDGIPEHYFDADNDGNADLVFTYFVSLDRNKKWQVGNQLYDIWYDSPRIKFLRKDFEQLRQAFTAERVCYNMTAQSRTWIRSNFNNLSSFQSIRINDKDFTAYYNSRKSIDTLLADNAGSIKVALQTSSGYTVVFDKPVSSSTVFAGCPAITVRQSEIVYSLETKNGFRNKIAKIDLSISNLHDKAGITQLSPDRSSFVRKADNAPELSITLYTGEGILSQPIVFSDNWNRFEMPAAVMSDIREKFQQAPAVSESKALFTVEGNRMEMINGNTLMIISDSLTKRGQKKIIIKPTPQTPVDAIWADGKQLDKGELNISEEMNGRKIELEFRDITNQKAKASLIVLLKDGPSETALPSTILTNEDNYRKYFKSIRIEEPKGKFVWVKEKRKHFLDNTNIDLSRPFRIQYKMNEASRIPDLIFGVNPNTDFLRVRFAGDSAILQEEHADGTVLPKGFVFPVTKRNDGSITLERRNNYLAEGIPGRRDYLLINDKPFIHFKTTELVSAYNARMGFDMSSAGVDFKFNEILLSEHNYREVAGNDPVKPITLHGALNRYLLNTEPADSIDYETDEARKTELFRQLQTNSYVLIISNYNYRISINQFPPAIVTQVRDELVDQLSLLQFKKENIVTLDNLTHDSLRRVFAYLLGGGSITASASLENIRKIFPAFNMEGKTKANIYLHYIGHASVNGISPIDISDESDAFPVSDWLRKVNTGDAIAVKNFLYIQDACYNSIQNLVALAPSDNLADHLFQYDANTTGREVILASKNSVTTNFNLTRGITRSLDNLSLGTGPFSTRELFPQLKNGGNPDVLNFGLYKLPLSQERTGTFIFYPKYLINEE